MEETTAPKWVRPGDPKDTYSNQFFVNWSSVDVRIRFGNMIPTSDRAVAGKSPLQVEEQVTVTMAWPQAKALRDSLNDVVQRFENTNGVIDLAKLRLPE